jgi:ParB family chromosome partitioning protein
MVEENRPRLGRGLAALIGDADENSRGASDRLKNLPIEFVRPNPANPRRAFSEDDIAELADSIREKGVLQPILVRPMSGTSDVYEIIAGERRWRSAQRAGLHEIPVRVVQATDQEALELAIVENVQRADLNPIEEALGYERLASEFGHSHLDIARITGKSRSHIANTVRLLKLPESTRKHVVAGDLTAGHARALLAVSDPEAVARQVMEEGLTVRDIEQRAKSETEDRKLNQRPLPREKDPDTRALEGALSELLGLAVAIKHKGESGEVSIKYKSLDQLDSLCQKLKQ